MRSTGIILGGLHYLEKYHGEKADRHMPDSITAV